MIDGMRQDFFHDRGYRAGAQNDNSYGPDYLGYCLPLRYAILFGEGSGTVMSQHDDITRNVLLEVLAERQRQTKKYGQETHPDGIGKDLNIFGTAIQCMRQAQYACDDCANDGSMTFLHILFEEVLEANAAPDKINLREELIQIAAAAVAWVEKIDRDLAG